MATPEFGTNLFDNENYQDPLELEILNHIRKRYTEEAAQYDSCLDRLPWEPHQDLKFYTAVPDDNVKLVVHDKIRDIGYFSPATGEYHIYSSFIDDEYLQPFLMLAGLKRQKSIESFNSRQNSKRWDYTHPYVKILHEEHNEALIQNGLGNAIAFKFNENPGVYRNEYMDVDEECHAAVYLKSKSRTYGGIEPFATIGIKLWGSYKFEGTGKKRETTRCIDLASIEDVNNHNSPYVPLIRKDEPLIDTDLLDELVKLSKIVRVLSDNVKGFSSTDLGILCRPGDTQHHYF